MKNLSMLLACLTLSTLAISAASADACPNFAGTYVLQNETQIIYGSVQPPSIGEAAEVIVITQTTCQHVVITSSGPFLSRADIVVDGQPHDLPTIPPANLTLTLTSHFDGDLLIGVMDIKGQAGKYMGTTTFELTPDQRTLLGSMVMTDLTDTFTATKK